MPDDIYREHIIDHYQHPRNFGDLPGADVTAREMNASCGDMIQIAIKFEARNPKSEIKDIKFKGIGCAISTAAASLLTESIKHQELSIKDLEKFTDEDMVSLLGIEVSPTRMKCATLPLRALQKVITMIRKQ